MLLLCGGRADRGGVVERSTDPPEGLVVLATQLRDRRSAEVWGRQHAVWRIVTSVRDGIANRSSPESLGDRECAWRDTSSGEAYEGNLAGH